MKMRLYIFNYILHTIKRIQKHYKDEKLIRDVTTFDHRVHY